jgi:hypothetical protein
MRTDAVVDRGHGVGHVGVIYKVRKGAVPKPTSPATARS